MECRDWLTILKLTCWVVGVAFSLGACHEPISLSLSLSLSFLLSLSLTGFGAMRGKPSSLDHEPWVKAEPQPGVSGIRFSGGPFRSGVADAEVRG